MLRLWWACNRWMTFCVEVMGEDRRIEGSWGCEEGRRAASLALRVE